MRNLYVAGWLFAALMAWVGIRGMAPDRSPVGMASRETPASTPMGEATRWFTAMRPYCNAVEVETRHRWTPPPRSFEGSAYSAACYALAGRIDRARAIIDGLEEAHRWRAAGIVFELAHPVADAGDDRSAGPIMEMVVDYWPNHYMALYHAGMARMGLGDRAGARDYLERFLALYHVDDGWTASARAALEEIGG